jgi:hypothetical protein
MTKMLIANRLTDGLVVFRAEDGDWSESIAVGQLISDDDESARLLEQALAEERNNKIIDPCLIDVSETDGRRIPDSYREEIRASGPTIDVGP